MPQATPAWPPFAKIERPLRLAITGNVYDTTGTARHEVIDCGSGATCHARPTPRTGYKCIVKGAQQHPCTTPPLPARRAPPAGIHCALDGRAGHAGGLWASPTATATPRARACCGAVPFLFYFAFARHGGLVPKARLPPKPHSPAGSTETDHHASSRVSVTMLAFFPVAWQAPATSPGSWARASPTARPIAPRSPTRVPTSSSWRRSSRRSRAPSTASPHLCTGAFDATGQHPPILCARLPPRPERCSAAVYCTVAAARPTPKKPFKGLHSPAAATPAVFLPLCRRPAPPLHARFGPPAKPEAKPNPPICFPASLRTARRATSAPPCADCFGVRA